MLEGDSLDEFMGNWLQRDKERKMARKAVYVDVIKIGEYRDDSSEEFSMGPAYELKVQLDVRSFEESVALRDELVSLVERFNEERRED